MVVPTALHVPVFVLVSLSLRQAAISPTPLTTESFLSAASLAQTDPYGIFPLAIGITSLVNFEISRRYFSAIRLNRAQWEDALDNVIRVASVVMVSASMMAPNVGYAINLRLYFPECLSWQCVTLYWITSTTYTLVQTVCFGLVDKGRERLKKTPSPTPPLKPPSPPPAPKEAARPPPRVVHHWPRRPR